MLLISDEYVCADGNADMKNSIPKAKKEHVALPRNRLTWCPLVREYDPNIHSDDPLCCCSVGSFGRRHTSSLQARRACQFFVACWSGQVLGESVHPCVWILPVLQARQGGLPISGQSLWNAHLSSNNGRRGEGASGRYSGRVSILLVLRAPPVTKLIFLWLTAVMMCVPRNAC